MMSPIAVPVWRPGPARTRSGAAGLPRLLPEGFSGRPATLAEHLARHGTLPSGAGDDRRRQALIREVERSGLRGRGGAGFPTAVKVRALAAAGRRPLVIANGTEGEPASAKDKTLLACAPHLVLDGAVYAAGLIGARQVVVVVHHAVRDIVARAADERRRSRYDGVPVRVLDAATGFVAGEASAVAHWVERGIALPSGKPPRLGGASRAGHPALVQNVETLAHLALIARHGAAWFRSAGTAEEPGSMLVTHDRGGPAAGCLRGRDRHPGRRDDRAGWRGQFAAKRAAHRRLLRDLGRRSSSGTAPVFGRGPRRAGRMPRRWPGGGPAGNGLRPGRNSPARPATSPPSRQGSAGPAFSA